MFCKNCGQQIDDNAAVCPNCGVATAAVPAAPVNMGKRKATGVALVAKVLIIICMIFKCLTVLPLVFGGIALSQMGKGKPTTGVSVCTLIFCSLIGGILLLCSEERNYV